MSIEEQEAAYLDAMKRLQGSVLEPQLAAPIEDYVNNVLGLCVAMMTEDFKEYETPLMKLAAKIAATLDTKSDQG